MDWFSGAYLPADPARTSLSVPIFALRFSCGTLFGYMSTTHEPLSARASRIWAPGNADSGRLAFLRPWLTVWYRMCGSARDGVAVAAYPQCLSGRRRFPGRCRGACRRAHRSGAGRRRGLGPPRLRHPPVLAGVKPADRDEPLDRRGCAVVVGGARQHCPAGSRFALVASEPALRARTP